MEQQSSIISMIGQLSQQSEDQFMLWQPKKSQVLFQENASNIKHQAQNNTVFRPRLLQPNRTFTTSEYRQHRRVLLFHEHIKKLQECFLMKNKVAQAFLQNTPSQERIRKLNDSNECKSINQSFQQSKTQFNWKKVKQVLEEFIQNGSTQFKVLLMNGQQAVVGQQLVRYCPQLVLQFYESKYQPYLYLSQKVEICE